MRIEIVTEDCVAGMAKIETGLVNVVMTSPPYNRGITYRSYEDRMDRGEYFSWGVRWMAGIRRVLQDEGSFFLNVGASAYDPLLPHELAILAVRGGWKLQNTIHWIKAISVDQPDGKVVSRGHFKPINSPRLLNSCQEYVFHFTKNGRVTIDRKAVGVPYVDKTNVARWEHTGNADLRCRGNAWFVPYSTIRSRVRERPHPATFPVSLAEMCLRLHGVKGGVVMDPFLGLGSTAIAAARLQAAHFVGFEIDPEYADQARAAVTKMVAPA